MRVAINGLGRIGRHFLKIALDKGIKVVAINDLTNTMTLAYLLKYDSVYRNYPKEVSYGKDYVQIGLKKIKVFTEKDPEQLPWKKLGVDVVIESTGIFRDRQGAGRHLKAGARKVVITAPAKDSDVVVVLGVNEKCLKKEHQIISMGSCTTNCLAPIAKVLNDAFGIQKGFMTTVHAYTNDQKILDLPHKNLRRGRAAAQNIIPTTSGATKSVVEVIPELKGKLDGLAMRVPVASGSIVDFVVNLKKSASVEEINKELKKAANGKMKGILMYSNDELVSSDVLGNPHSSIVDGLSTQSLGGMTKILSWYDNEFGYSNRLVDLLKILK